MAMVGSWRPWRSSRASQAAMGVLTVRTLVLPPWDGPDPHGWRWISTDETARDGEPPGSRATSQSESPRQQASTHEAMAAIRLFLVTLEVSVISATARNTSSRPPRRPGTPRPPLAAMP